MPRNYKRSSTRQPWESEAMQQAIDEVLSGRMGYKRAAENYQVPQKTLERRVKKARDGATVEEASKKGKGMSIWDYYTERNPEKFANGSNGNIACDSYHNYKEDVQLLKRIGVDFYKFSISWSRILPDGYSNNRNMKGIMYYNNLLDELISKNIEPIVTMYHWDLPVRLQEIGGWTNPYMAYYFEDYARILFSYYGDKVKYWVTLNMACKGYGDDDFPPFLNQSGIGQYLCTNVMLLAHAKVYHLYDGTFRMQQKGRVGIVLDGSWFEPGSSSPADTEATERVRAFKLGLYLNPIFNVNGDYPKLVRARVDHVSSIEGFMNSRLPLLGVGEIEYIQGTYDFLGLNMYTTYLVKDVPESNSSLPSKNKDLKAILYKDPSWEKTNIDWLTVYPGGLRKCLKWIMENFDDPEIFIMENGYSDDGDIHDYGRIRFIQKHLQAILEAIYEDGVNVRGYSVWSLLDNFEWVSGYNYRFGLYRVNFTDPKRPRSPKKSADWYRKVVRAKRLIGLEV